MIVSIECGTSSKQTASSELGVANVEQRAGTSERRATSNDRIAIIELWETEKEWRVSDSEKR